MAVLLISFAVQSSSPLAAVCCPAASLAWIPPLYSHLKEMHACGSGSRALWHLVPIGRPPLAHGAGPVKERCVHSRYVVFPSTNNRTDFRFVHRTFLARCVNIWHICVTVCAKRSDGPERRPLEGARVVVYCPPFSKTNLYFGASSFSPCW